MVQRQTNRGGEMDEEEVKTIVGRKNGNEKLCIQNPNDEL